MAQLSSNTGGKVVGVFVQGDSICQCSVKTQNIDTERHTQVEIQIMNKGLKIATQMHQRSSKQHQTKKQSQAKYTQNRHKWQKKGTKLPRGSCSNA